MPTVALLSDIHANLHALRAVLDEVARLGIDQIAFCGDIVGYGPHSAECVKLVRETGGLGVMGNHDFYTVAASRQPGAIPSDPESLCNPVLAGIHHAVKHLDQDAIEWLGSLPSAIAIPGAVVAHSALHDPEHWPYLRNSEDAKPTLEILKRMEIEVGFFGHTHQQEWFSLPDESEKQSLTNKPYPLRDGSVYAVIVGSVGQPRSGDTRAAWTLWDSDARNFEFRRTVYPQDQTARDIYAAGLPGSSARRLLGNP